MENKEKEQAQAQEQQVQYQYEKPERNYFKEACVTFIFGAIGGLGASMGGLVGKELGNKYIKPIFRGNKSKGKR